MRKFLSLFIAIAMLVSFVPTFASAEDTEFTPVTVDFTKAKVSGTAPYGVSSITGTGFNVVVDESTVYTSNQTRKLGAGLQIAAEKELYFSASSNSPAAPIAQFTIMVDMGENAKAGLYDIAFTGASWYPASNLHIFADGRYIGDYTAICTDTIDLTVGEEVVYKSVYLQPDENNQVKFMFAVAKLGHDTSTGSDGNKYVDTKRTYGEGRILLNKLVISESAEPATQETVELSLGREKMAFIDNQALTDTTSNLKIIEKFEVVNEKTPEGVSRCYNSSNLVQIQTRSGAYSRWPFSKTRNDMYTIETVIPKAGFYSVYMQGYKSYAGSDYAIYVNGEYAGDYSSWNGYTTSEVATVLGELEQLNTIELPRGNVEISFRSRKAHYNTPNLYPYKIQFVPAEKAQVSQIETKLVDAENGEVNITSELAGNFAVGTEANFVARAKMTDETYRSFGYTDAGAIPTEDVITVTSTNPEVVAVSDVVCVEAATASSATISQVIDSTATKFKLTAVKPGSADIVVTAIIDGKEEKVSTTTVTVPSNAPGVAADAKVKVFVAAENGGSIASSDVTVKEVDEVNLGKSVTVSASDTDELKFSYWKNGAGKFVSAAKTYTFVANTNTALVAVFDKKNDTDDLVNVNFFNQHKALIGSKKVTKGTTFEAAKDGIDTTLTGYVLDKWSIADGEVINSAMNAVALYNVADTEYSAYFFDGNDTIPADTKTGKYGDIVTYTATGDNFSYWVVADGSNRIVSYDKIITFSLWTTIAVKAVYGEDAEAVPTIVLDKQGDSRFIAYVVPSGYTPVSAGIVFSKSGTPEINICYSRAVSENVSTQGQFTARPAEDETIARGFLMFKDSEGNTRVIYAD